MLKIVFLGHMPPPVVATSGLTPLGEIGESCSQPGPPLRSANSSDDGIHAQRRVICHAAVVVKAAKLPAALRANKKSEHGSHVKFKAQINKLCLPPFCTLHKKKQKAKSE